MKHAILFMFIQLIFVISSGSSVDLKRFSFPSVGAYQLIIKQVYNCNPTKNNKIHHNLYVSHKGNSTLVLGNTTLEIPFDDTLSLEMRMAVKDSLGNWKENVFSHKVPNACSSLKKLMGNSWKALINKGGSQNTECPIPLGTYISTGIDQSLIQDSNIPKTFLYGKFKFYSFYTKKNEMFGCILFIIETKRP